VKYLLFTGCTADIGGHSRGFRHGCSGKGLKINYCMREQNLKDNSKMRAGKYDHVHYRMKY
jgi:hypothetical protein